MEEDLAEPMVKYWKMKYHDSLNHEMQVECTPEEWIARGIKLHHKNDYGMATMCFERAGQIYLEKAGDSELERAADCFSLAGCYELAAKVYARGNFLSECLTACSKGQLFDLGFEYVQEWKQQTTKGCVVAKRLDEISEIEQVFLESCAFHYHGVKDYSSMMKIVRAFNSMNSIRDFLTLLCCFDELLLFEEESGNFEEAAKIALRKGDLLLTADLLGKAGKFRLGANYILFYVLGKSLWSPGSRGWPLKQFRQKCELLAKAKSFARHDTNFYELVCIEADIMEHKQVDLVTLVNQMITSGRHNSVRGEILSARKILDIHLSSKVDLYLLGVELVFDLPKYSEYVISNNVVSVESLVYFWNFWKDNIVVILEYLQCRETQDATRFRNHEKFCLNFLGVWRQLNDLNRTHHLLISEADWARGVEKISSSGRPVSIDVCQFVSAAQSYWGSEILSVGLMVLEKLKAIFYCPRFSELLFCRSKILTTVHEIAKLILELKVLKLGHHDRKTLLEFTRLATENFVSIIFPTCWWKSLTEDMVAFRRTEACKDLLMHVLAESFRSKKRLSYENIASIAMIVLGSGKLHKELNEEISKSLEGKPAWKVFFENQHRLREVNGSTHASELVTSFREALEDVHNVHGRKFNDCMSPCSFLYLVERLMIWSSSFSGYFFSTRSSFVEWFFFDEVRVRHSSGHKLEDWCLPAIKFMSCVVEDCLNDKRYMFDWIKRSTKTDHYTEVLLRFVVVTLLLYVNFGECISPFVDLLRTGYISEQLPLEVRVALRVALEVMAEGKSPSTTVNQLAEILKKFNDPLVIVSLENECQLTYSSAVIAVDLKGSYSRNNVLRILFPEKIETPKVSTGASTIKSGESSTVPSETQSKHNGNSTSKKSKKGRRGRKK